MRARLPGCAVRSKRQVRRAHSRRNPRREKRYTICCSAFGSEGLSQRRGALPRRACQTSSTVTESERRLSGKTRRDTASSASELGEDLIRGDYLSALSFVVALDDCGLELGALVLIHVVAVVDDSQ